MEERLVHAQNFLGNSDPDFDDLLLQPAMLQENKLQIPNLKIAFIIFLIPSLSTAPDFYELFIQLMYT